MTFLPKGFDPCEGLMAKPQLLFLLCRHGYHSQKKKKKSPPLVGLSVSLSRNLSADEQLRAADCQLI